MNAPVPPSVSPSAPSSVPAEVLARARARLLGAHSIAVSDPAPPGLVAASDGSRVWLLSPWPDGATPAVLEEYDIAPMPLDRPGQARRVLAAALRCCWPRLDEAPWPGERAPVGDVLEVYARMSRGDPELARRWATGELRRLHDTGWLLLDEEAATVRPGPRIALWPEGSLGSLRDLIRRLPQPPEPLPHVDEQAAPAGERHGPDAPVAPQEPGGAVEDAGE